MEVFTNLLLCIVFIINTSNCLNQFIEPCYGLPTVENLEMLICTGQTVQMFPTLTDQQVNSVQHIYIYDTNMFTLPETNKTLYHNLVMFEEENNPFMNCSYIESWKLHHPSALFVSDDCQLAEHTSANIETTSQENSSKYTDTTTIKTSDNTEETVTVSYETSEISSSSSASTGYETSTNYVKVTVSSTTEINNVTSCSTESLYIALFSTTSSLFILTLFFILFICMKNHRLGKSLYRISNVHDYATIEPKIKNGDKIPRFKQNRQKRLTIIENPIYNPNPQAPTRQAVLKDNRTDEIELQPMRSLHSPGVISVGQDNLSLSVLSAHDLGQKPINTEVK